MGVISAGICSWQLWCNADISLAPNCTLWVWEMPSSRVPLELGVNVCDREGLARLAPTAPHFVLLTLFMPVLKCL